MATAADSKRYRNNQALEKGCIQIRLNLDEKYKLEKLVGMFDENNFTVEEIVAPFDEKILNEPMFQWLSQVDGYIELSQNGAVWGIGPDGIRLLRRRSK